MSTLDLTKPQSNAPAEQKKPFSEILKSKLANVLQGKRLDNFVVDTVAMINKTPTLAQCDHVSLISSVLQAQSLNLSLNSMLGQCYIVPFNNRKKGVKEATFQIGYKGYIQLAIRSGEYKKINVMAIKKDELLFYDPLNEEIEVKLIQDEIEREKAETIGYYAMFEYTNGFRKAMYWSRERMEAHARKYSFAYNAQDKSSFWFKDFDGMAYKTMLRQILSKWGIMSIEMQSAYSSDYHKINEDLTPSDDFIDADYENVEYKDISAVESKTTQTPPVEENSQNTKTDDTKKANKKPSANFVKCPIDETEILDSRCTDCEEKASCPNYK